MTITRTETIALLAEHGFDPWTPTCYDAEGRPVQGTSFDCEMGIMETYELSAIREWLGY